jgi:hypothetical protein
LSYQTLLAGFYANIVAGFVADIDNDALLVIEGDVEVANTIYIPVASVLDEV